MLRNEDYNVNLGFEYKLGGLFSQRVLSSSDTFPSSRFTCLTPQSMSLLTDFGDFSDAPFAKTMNDTPIVH